MELTDEFAECASCKAKPGSPELCAACLHNRTLVHRLQKALESSAADEREACAKLVDTLFVREEGWGPVDPAPFAAAIRARSVR